VWSPDGKWIAYSKPDAARTSDIYVIASSGEEKEPHKVTFDSNNDINPRFGPDGRKLFFQRITATGAGNAVQLYSVWLEHLDRDPDDAEEREAEVQSTSSQGEGADGAVGPRRQAPANRPVRDIKMDWAGMKHRTRQITRMPFPISNYTIAPDSRTIVFVTSEPAGLASVPVIYSIQDDGRRLTRITSGQPPTDEAEGGPGGGGGFGGGVSQLNISRDGRTLFFREREGVYSVPMGTPQGAAGAGAGAGAGGGTGASTVAGAGTGGVEGSISMFV
jgi:tricorn protease